MTTYSMEAAAMTSWKAEKATTGFTVGTVMTPSKAEKITTPLWVVTVLIPTALVSVPVKTRSITTTLTH